MIDLTELSEDERWDYLVAVLRKGKWPRAGRPKKGSDIPKWRDFGLSRKDAWRMRRFAEIPDGELLAFMDLMRAKGKRLSHRAIFVHFGKINVPTENDFDGTNVGEFARSLLAPCERLLETLNERERRILKRAVYSRFLQIFRTKPSA